MRYKFRQLKNHIKKKPFRRDGYRIEGFTLNGSYITYEKYGEQKKVDFICKRLGLYQVGKPMFFMRLPDFEPTLPGIYYMINHGQRRWIGRIWDSVSNQIKQQKDREYRTMIGGQTENIKNIHIIFSEKW